MGWKFKSKEVPKEIKDSVKASVQSKPKVATSNAPKKKGNKLRDIVDRDKLFTMIYSGVEQEKYFNILYDMGIRDFLMSYHYLSKGGYSTLQRLKGLDIRLFIDSGAFTYKQGGKNGEYLEYTVEQWEAHIVKYLEWAERNKEIIFAIADLDLQDLVGTEVVTRWRREYFEPFMLRTGIPVCFVWHDVDGLEEWERNCQRYPYVGVSWVMEANSEGRALAQNLVKVAEKHGALIHGFGMTQTSQLTKLPLYTCDSTTWLVGLQYGEVNWWTGTKMTRLKKDKWKGEYLGKIVSEYKLDKDKLLDENTEELIKVNLHAFIEAEEYIRHRLKARMYWLRPEAVENDIESITDDFFPSQEWIDNYSNNEDWEEYANKMNITTSDKNTALDNIIDMTCFLNWDSPEYADYIKDVYKEEFIDNLYEFHVNQICDSLEEKIADLQHFYRECLEGKNNRLLLLGTNFQTKAKERDSYIEERDYELEDLTDDQVRDKLKDILALPNNEDGESIAPEITELDDEIFAERNIVAVRDEKGRFLKGQQKVRKPKKVYSDKYPKLACDTCHAGQTCPEHRAGYVCAYNKMFGRFDTRDMGDIIEAMQSMVGLNLERMQRATIFEMLNGGMPDGTVTGMIDQNMRLLNNLKQMYEFGGRAVAQYTKTVHSDGTQTESVQVTNPGGGGSILEKLFASSPTPPKEEEPVVDTTAKEEVIDVVVEEEKFDNDEVEFIPPTTEN